MFSRCTLAAFLMALVVGFTATAQDKKPEEKKNEPRKGNVTGAVTAKGDNWIEVKADGEEKARKYFVGRNNADAQKVLKELAVESRVQMEWAFGESFIAVKIEVLKKPSKDDKKEPAKEDKKDEPRKGTVTGVVSAKGENWIEVKADGEEKARRYVPHWRGGAPAAGGGLDKEMLAKMKDTPVNARVKIDWEFEERARVVKIEVLKKPEEKKDK